MYNPSSACHLSVKSSMSPVLMLKNMELMVKSRRSASCCGVPNCRHKHWGHGTVWLKWLGHGVEGEVPLIRILWWCAKLHKGRSGGVWLKWVGGWVDW